jgi:hypothetical protein
MPNNLTGSKAKLTYQELLHVSDGIDGTLKTVYDGDGTALPIKVSNNQVSISSTSSSDAFKINQTGSGNAFVVEDSTSPDSNPFVIDANGNVINGYTAATGVKNYANNAIIPRDQLHGLTLATGTMAPTVWSPTASNAPGIVFSKSLGTSVNSYTLVTNNAALGAISFAGSDGAEFQTGASILSSVDGTAGLSSMPARLSFSTTPSGAVIPVERMRISSNGNISIGTSTSVRANVDNRKPITGATTFSGNLNFNIVQNDVTTMAVGYESLLGTLASSFVLAELDHFRARQSTIGAGSSVTNQYGFYVENTLVGATNNYGFHANIPSGTDRWNFYAAGSANNYFAGSLGIGSTSLAGYNINIQKNITGAVTSYGVFNSGDIQSDVTTSAHYYATTSSTQATAFTLTDLYHYRAIQGTFGAGSTVTNQIGFSVSATLIGGTNNFAFRGMIPSGTNRWNFYAGGTADNAFAGNSRFGGTTTPVATVDVTGSVLATTTILSKGPTSGIGYATGAGGAVTQATSKTTGVTLNTVSGQITLNAASLAANTAAGFTLTNSAISATDVIQISIASGVTTAGSYFVVVDAVANGSCRITIRNVTAGALAEALVLNFAVIKAVIS